MNPTPALLATLATLLALWALSLLALAAWLLRRQQPAARPAPARQPPWESLVTDAPVGVLLLDQHLRVVFANRRWRDDNALGLEPLAGRPLAELAPELAARWNDALRNALNGGSHFQEEDRIARDNGIEQVFSCQITPWPGPGGTSLGACVIAVNLTGIAEVRDLMRSNRRRLESMLDNMSDGFLRMEAVRDEHHAIVNFRFTAANPTALRLLRSSPEKLLGGLTRELFPFVDTLGLHADAVDIITTGVPRRYEEVSIPGYDILCNGTMWKVEDDLVLVFQDITERRDALLRLRETRRRFDALAASASLGICTLDQNGHIVDANATLCQLVGHPASGLTGRPAADALGKPLPDASPGDTELRHASGRSVPVLATRTPLRDDDGTPAGEIVTFHDLSELRNTAEALRISQANYRTFIASTSEGIVELSFDPPLTLSGDPATDADRLLAATPRCTIINRAAERLIDARAPGAWTGQPVPLARLALAVGEEAARRLALDLCRHQFAVEDRVFDSAHRDTAAATFRLTANGDVRQGALTRLAIVLSDVTEQTLRERSLRQTQKLESLGLMAGGIAHDFNNLLVGIMGQASLAELDIAPDDPLRKRITEILKGAERASDLTRQLLAYSGKGQFKIEPLNLTELVHDNTTLLETITEKKALVHTRLDPRLPSIQGDRGQVLQVLMNLVINGAEACPDRSGTVRVSTFVTAVAPEADPASFVGGQVIPGTFACLEVADTGSGMDEATTARIFDPFFTTKFTGRGLGLSALLGIVRGHQAQLQLVTAPGRGTTFRVLFPVPPDSTKPPLDAPPLAMPEAPVPQPAAEPPALKLQLNGATLLHVEDESGVLHMMRLYLERLGGRIVAAANSAELDQRLAEPLPRLRAVLLDLIMTDLRPADAVARIRAVHPRVPIVICSGYNEAEARSMVDFQHIAGFLGKPFRMEDLATLLATLPSPDERVPALHPPS